MEEEPKSSWLKTHLGNLILAAYLTAMASHGVLNADETWDQVWWITVSLILVVNVLRRMAPINEDCSPKLWVLVFLSVSHLFFFQEGPNSITTRVLVLGAVFLSDVCLLYLGPSFSLFPARREIKTGFLYRAVRHPAYALYILMDILYVAAVPQIHNVVVALLGICSFVLRAHYEEKILSEDPAYLDYQKKTPWRFMPGIY